MKRELDLLLEQLLLTYPNALGVSFHSLEHPITLMNGSNTSVLEQYKDIATMSVDESFNTEFIFIIMEEGTVITFFLENEHFVSVFTNVTDPSKELAQRMYNEFAGKFLKVINKIDEASTVI